MSTPLERLMELQRLDDALTETEREQRQIPVQRLRNDRALEEARKDLAARKQALQSATLQQRGMEKALQASTEQIQKKQARKFDVKSNEEYKALLKEIEFTEQEHSRTEDELLALFEEIDALAQSVRSLEDSVARQERELDQDRTRLQEEDGNLRRVREDLLLKRQAVCLDLDASLLQDYERIRRNRQGQAVVVARGDVCGGCHMAVPPQTVNDVLQTGEVRCCPHCLRILYCVMPEEEEV